MVQNIVLTGFMGTGKTTVGRLLAAALDRDFVDTDAMIVEQAGRSIRDIFQNDGPDAFRAMETVVSHQLSQQHNLIISTGGRLMLDPENADALMKNGRVFCLNASAATIYARVVSDGEKRPLINVPDPLARIQTLLDERKDGYGRFPQIDVNDKEPTAIMAEILERLGDSEIGRLGDH